MLNIRDFGTLIFILKMCDDIEVYKEDMKIIDILNSRMGLNAVLMNIMQIGEYTKKLSYEFTNLDKEYWKNIAGLRDRIAHDYGGVNLEIIEIVLRDKIDELIEKIFKILKNNRDNLEIREFLFEKTFLENFNSKKLYFYYDKEF
jgi:uncharacterized protein with HEPN domain